MLRLEVVLVVVEGCFFDVAVVILVDGRLADDKPGDEARGNIRGSDVLENFVVLAVSPGGRGDDVATGASDIDAFASEFARGF